MFQLVLLAIFVLTKHAAGDGTNGVPSSAQHFIKSLSLLRQPYGNYMKETFNSPFTVDHLPARFAGGKRVLSANIFNLFAVDSDEGQSQGSKNTGFWLAFASRSVTTIPVQGCIDAIFWAITTYLQSKEHNPS
ncbi:hypothetical protein CYMTET_25102 [Cymbomonas tetramitiformis]|uniref:Uncharacterized protein n=1 Tax=Cymbomonas tetramitiformis TaxID=36881 RepID=A0AAE0FUS4_9CHLO|nr:hypothetical protein CYMTET_25102 [Cymbomonas tetramitiformis]